MRLGPVNLALISIYFGPVWGSDALGALISRYNGFEDRAHAAVAIHVRELFDFNLAGLVLTSNILAGIKLVIAAGFVAYLIEFARALVTGRAVERQTIDVVLMLAVVGIAIWAVPAVTLADGAVVRLYATQILMVVGAIFVLTVERQIETAPQAAESIAAPETPAPRVPGDAQLARATVRAPLARPPRS